MTDPTEQIEPSQSRRIAESLDAYSAARSELGRQFARHMGMHTTDSAAVVEILRAEGRGHPLTPSRLAGRIGLTGGATSILLNRLEAAGHVTRRRGHADRRRVTLHTAASVSTEAERYFAPLRARVEEVITPHSTTELDLLERLLTELRDVVDSFTDSSAGEHAAAPSTRTARPGSGGERDE